MIYGDEEMARVRAMTATQIAQEFAGEGGDLVAAIEIYGDRRFQEGRAEGREEGLNCEIRPGMRVRPEPDARGPEWSPPKRGSIRIDSGDSIQLGKALPGGGYEVEIRDKDGKLKRGGA